jgi:prevent-host-death family protein
MDRDTGTTSRVPGGRFDRGQTSPANRLGTHATTATLCSNRMESRTIPQRELRNNIAEVLRDAEAGTEFTITVRGRPVARLGPADHLHMRRLDVDRDTFSAIIADTPVDHAFATDIARARSEEEPVGDPWDRP